MNHYVENPKTKGSGVICCIPQVRKCPMNCPDCFFQSGRSYLEPLGENLPNMPSLEEVGRRIVRVNDGNDSNIDPLRVYFETEKYPLKFYNTSIPKHLTTFPGPVVLTVNPGRMTDSDFHSVPAENLMFVRARINTWNLELIDEIVYRYTSLEISTILTFMAYHEEENIPGKYKNDYVFRKRTLNDYWAISRYAWETVMRRYTDNPYVYSCGKEGLVSGCKYCGNCIREFYAFYERNKH